MVKNVASKPRVFISYSPRDADRRWLRGFVRALNRRGASAWWDELEVPAGESLVDAVEKAMRDSDIILVILSPDALHSANLAFEIGAALGMGKRLVAVVPKSIDLQDVPIPLRTRRFLMQESPDDTARQLLGAVESDESKRAS